MASGNGFRATLSALASAFVALFGVSATHAFDLSGERIEMIVPFAEGGGTDVYARFIAPYYREVLPGNPTIVIRNIPGAGSVAGANQFDQRAKPDGLTVLVSSTSTLLNYLMGDKRVRYEAKDWIPIVVTPLGQVIYASPTVGVKGRSLADDLKALRSRELVWGSNGPATGDLPHMIFADMLGLNVTPVFGVNRGQSRVAYERGEFNFNFDTMAAYRKNGVPLVEAGKAVPLWSMGYMDDNGMLVRDPGAPELPIPTEVLEAAGKKPEGSAWEAWTALFNVSVMVSKAIVLPKGTPADIVEGYVSAMRKVVSDPEFLKAAESQTGGYPQLVGAPADRAFRGSITMSDETRRWLFAWLKEKYDYEP